MLFACVDLMNWLIISKYSTMKKKLYIKNDKGRYEEYQIPDMDVSETLFRRINGKYVPVSVNCTNDLPEGVWVVTRPELRKAVMIMLDLCTQVQRTIIQKEKEND